LDHRAISDEGHNNNNHNDNNDNNNNNSHNNNRSLDGGGGGSRVGDNGAIAATAAAFADRDGDQTQQIYISKLPIDRPNGCYWYKRYC